MMAAALVVPSLGLSSPLQAQSGAVVQPLPPAAAVERLNSNLSRIARNPQDVDALLGAGQAALDLGDVQAANGFFTRANTVNPRLGRVKMGLAGVQLALKQPEDAAANYDAAEALGEPIGNNLADRGLAYDLTGQQAKAQRDYQAALRANPGDSKTVIRYAVSLGISGHLAEADKLLEPALTAGDREAWRFRAFIYAMNGRVGEARNITQSVMPKGLADALDPYMARVSLLTPAQKAAAAHYGDFPANVLRLAVPAQAPATVAARETKPAEPARAERKTTTTRRERNRAASAAAQAAAAPPSRTPAQTQAAPPRPAPVTQASAPPPPPPAPARSQPPTTLTGGAVTPTPAPSQPAPATLTPATPERTLATALSSLTVPEAERSRPATAVDLQALAKIQADKAKAEREAKAKAEKEAKANAEAAAKKKLKDNPARTWVQLAAGKNVSALGFDLRRFRRTYGDAIGDESGWYVDWGATNRLLIGPYAKPERAREVVAAIKKAGGDAFVWQSEAGEEIKKIGAQ